MSGNKTFILCLFTSLVATSLSASHHTTRAACNGERSCTVSLAKSVLPLNPNWKLMKCEGRSMEPFLSPEDLVIVDHGNLDQLKVGMLVVFRSRTGESILHQVIEISAEGLLTKGSRNETEDADPITHENYIGHVVAVFHLQPGELVCFANLPVAFCKIQD